MYNEFKRLFLDELLWRLMNLEERSDEALTWVRSRKGRRWRGHGRFWEGMRWTVKILRDSLGQLERSDMLFDEQIEDALHLLAERNERQRRKIQRLEAEAAQTSLNLYGQEE